MNKTLLKYQLNLFLLFTLFNLIFYYLGATFPDNALSISSNTDELNIISYYLASLVSFISYYTGIWLILPFFTFALTYILILSKRFKNYDVFVPLLTISFYFGFFYFFIPSLIGEGLLNIISPYLGTISILSISFISFCLIFYICILGTFKSNWNLINNSINFMINRIKIYVNQKINNLKLKFNKLKKSYNSNKLEVKATAILKSKHKKDVIEKEIKVENVGENLFRPNHVQSEIVNHLENEKIEAKSTEKILNTQIRDIKNLNIPNRNVFFETNDLIDCIAGHGLHNTVSNPDDEYFSIIQQAIEEKFSEFKVDARIINVLKGPVVDTFELDLGPAIKVSKVMGLSDDIGLALNGAPIRIVYPMKGRSTIGIEVPRNPRDLIFLDEVLRSEQFNSSRHRLPVAMGRDAFGEVSVVDLAAMPHMLVAGATGAGKSVFINTLLVSLIVKMSPRQMKLLLIDPKQLELALYQELPHLMLPVITEAKSASIALLWAVQEMERRYSILKEMGVKNIEGFNKKIKNSPSESLARMNKFYEDQVDEGYELPYLVIIIDEFADLILTKSGKEIEDNVNRLAAKARAAGIHIVLATQRPSTDVVTGVIKANFPTRVAFRVTTATDSRVILDQLGAEKLLGKGDMLYKHGVDVMRIHSSYVDEDEIEQLVNKLSTIPASFNMAAMNFLENVDEDQEQPVTVTYGMPKATGDELYDEAVQVVIEQGSASASMLQRRLRVGYNRAANLVEEMEKNGIVGPQQGSKPRDILITRSE